MHLLQAPCGVDPIIEQALILVYERKERNSTIRKSVGCGEPVDRYGEIASRQVFSAATIVLMVTENGSPPPVPTV